MYVLILSVEGKYIYIVHSPVITVGLYADSAHGPIFVLQDTDNAITHLQFSLDGQCLFSGARKV